MSETPHTQGLREAYARAEAAFLVALAEAGIPTDVQGLLVGGDERGTVAPGALRKALENALPSLLALPSPRSREEPDYWPSRELLSEIVHLQDEHDALNGGGPGWSQRWAKALDAAREEVRIEP